VKREKGESEAGGCEVRKWREKRGKVSPPEFVVEWKWDSGNHFAGGWRLVIRESEDSPYHPQDEGFGVGSVLRSLGPRCLVGGNHLVVVFIAL